MIQKHNVLHEKIKGSWYEATVLTHWDLNKKGCHFAQIFKYIFLKENVSIFIHISKFIPKIPIEDKSAINQAMALHWMGDKALPDPMLTHIYHIIRHYRLTKPQYHTVSYISRTLVGNKIVDHSDVVGASPVGAAPTTSSFST